MVVITKEESLEMEEPNQGLLRAEKSHKELLMVDFLQVHSLRVLIVLIWPKIWTDKIATFIRVLMSTIISNWGFKQVMEWETHKIMTLPMVKWALILNKLMLGLEPMFHLEWLSKVKLALHQVQLKTRKVDRLIGTFKIKWHNQQRHIGT